MKQNRMTLACVLSVAIASTQFAAAVSADNPYLTTITNRNLFHLTAPPDPALLIPVVAPPPLPEVKLAGITTLMGKTLAILRVPRAAKPPDPAKEISVFLEAGAPGEEGVQVVAINIAAGTVKIDNHGTPQLLDFTKNAPKPTGVPSPAGGLPVPPPRPGGVIPVPAPASAAAPAVTSIGRPLRSDPGSQSGAAVPGGGPGQVGTSAVPLPLTREEQVIMIEANRIQEPHLPFPPTELQEMMDQEQQGNQPPGTGGPPRF